MTKEKGKTSQGLHTEKRNCQGRKTKFPQKTRTYTSVERPSKKREKKEESERTGSNVEEDSEALTSKPIS